MAGVNERTPVLMCRLSERWTGNGRRAANMRAWSKEFWQKQTDILGAAKGVKNEFGVRECRLADTGPKWTKP